MEIAQKDANEIVMELSELIHLKMNIVNKQAIIIANSDAFRIGDFHEATQKIRDEKLTELVVTDSDLYQGTQAGTNLPLVIDHEFIGVVGITGPYKTAIIYGQIIKKMTELLIQGKEYTNKINRHKIAQTRFQEEWICNPKTSFSNELKARGLNFGIDITKTRRVMVISIHEKESEKIPFNTLVQKEEAIEKSIRLKDPLNTIFMTSNRIVATFPCKKDTKSSDSQMKMSAKKIIEKHKDDDFFISIGIDEAEDNYVNINLQYEKALKAQQFGSKKAENCIIRYGELDLELLFREVSERTKLIFMDKIFHQYTQEERAQALEAIHLLYEENGSLTKAAKRLHKHPNSLQYQIKKIMKNTGYDPRRLDNAAIFTIANIFQEETHR